MLLLKKSRNKKPSLKVSIKPAQDLKQASNTLEQLLFLMKAHNQRFSQELHKSLQLFQDESQYGDMTTYLLDQK